MSCSIATALLITLGRLEVWHIYLTITLSLVFNTFGNLAYTANISLLVPKQHLGRASGMVQVADAVAQLVSPLLAGVLFIITGILTIISTVVAYQYPRLRLLEKELPDVA